MATILAFRTVASKREEMHAGDQSASAEVILFPGVRYERWTELEAHAPRDAASVMRNRGKQRDVLELAE